MLGMATNMFDTIANTIGLQNTIRAAQHGIPI
jgi:hypothetical protein